MSRAGRGPSTSARLCASRRSLGNVSAHNASGSFTVSVSRVRKCACASCRAACCRLRAMSSASSIFCRRTRSSRRRRSSSAAGFLTAPRRATDPPAPAISPSSADWLPVNGACTPISEVPLSLPLRTSSAAARINFSNSDRRSLCVGTSLKRGSNAILGITRSHRLVLITLVSVSRAKKPAEIASLTRRAANTGSSGSASTPNVESSISYSSGSNVTSSSSSCVGSSNGGCGAYICTFICCCCCC
mmetsp:Transcript_29691/g.74193  ORF Transcript_29691/g.74193 Transcript_29691/m.74193 type:complete len:245 (+) Transcript_29691:118-852(+)